MLMDVGRSAKVIGVKRKLKKPLRRGCWRWGMPLIPRVFLGLAVFSILVSSAFAVQEIPVKAYTLSDEKYHPKVVAMGRLYKAQEQSLSFKTSGYVAGAIVSAGSYVKQGQRLIGLQLDEIQARVNKSRSLLQQAKLDYQRLTRLRAKGVATKEQVDNALTHKQVAASELEVAEYNLRYSTLKAPENGQLLQTLVEINEWVRPGQAVALFAPKASPWVFRFGLAEDSLSLVHKGQEIQVKLATQPDVVFKAKISEITAAVDRVTGLYATEATLVNPLTHWRSGFTGMMTLVSSVATDWIALPIAALVNVEYPYAFAYRILDAELERVKVRIAAIEGDRVWVQPAVIKDQGYAHIKNQGSLQEPLPLAPGQHIVFLGARFVKPGSQLRIEFDNKEPPRSLLVEEHLL